MQRIYQQDGWELVALLEQAHRQGVTTSLDMALPGWRWDGGAGIWSGRAINLCWFKLWGTRGKV